MSNTATINGKQETSAAIHAEDLDSDVEEVRDESSKSSRRGNIFMRKLDPEMLISPHPIDFADGMMSDAFCYEKALREFIKPLEIKSQDEWLKFCNEVWQWAEQAENREIDAKVDEFMKQLEVDPIIADRLKARMLQKEKANGKK